LKRNEKGIAAIVKICSIATPLHNPDLFIGQIIKLIKQLNNLVVSGLWDSTGAFEAWAGQELINVFAMADIMDANDMMLVVDFVSDPKSFQTH
jgi:hypothetical protein